jgi:hypothetical protein
MAITRTQIARQLYQAGGGADFGAPDKAEERASKGYGNVGGGKPASKGFKQDAEPFKQDPSVYGKSGPYQRPDDKELRKIFNLKPDQKIGETKKEYKSRKRQEKIADKASKDAFRRFQKLEERGLVSMLDDYSMSGIDLAKLSGYNYNEDEDEFTYDPEFFRDKDTGAFKEKFLYTSPITKKTSLQIPGYEFGNIDKFGKPTLRSNVGTSIESVKPNIGDLQERGIGLLDLVGRIVNPDTQVGAFNTLTDARNIQEFADRIRKGDDSAIDEYEDYMKERTVQPPRDDDGPSQVTDPCKGPNPPAYCFVNQDPTPDPTPDRNLGGLAPRFAGSIFDFTGMADGGRIGAAEGGIMDLETGRQMYFLGKLVKKATRAVKKIAKSPIGKAALLGGALYFGGGGAGGFSGLLKKGLLKKGATEFTLANLSPMKAIGLASLGSAFLTPEEEEDDPYRGPDIDIANIRANPYNFLAPRFTGTTFAADGGLMRIGYQEGSKEPVASKTMPLLDMDGKEMDLRDNGGFVPIGRMEKADDVPARLSKNEFVFTADAVRNAGDGDVDKGAEVMYNMMKNLESGGEVSEESQGLQGAREMFQTSKRLEEVL